MKYHYKSAPDRSAAQHSHPLDTGQGDRPIRALSEAVITKALGGGCQKGDTGYCLCNLSPETDSRGSNMRFLLLFP